MAQTLLCSRGVGVRGDDGAGNCATERPQSNVYDFRVAGGINNGEGDVRRRFEHCREFGVGHADGAHRSVN